MIEGTSVNLRALEDDDATTFHRWFNDPEVTRFGDTNAFPAVSMAQERDIVQRIRSDQDQRAYSIVLKDGTLIGTCALRGFDWTARACEAGITIGEPQYWGQGYGGSALELLLKIAFDGLNLHKVWLTCADYNERGQRAYRRIGFREEGRLRDARFLDGRYRDTVIMSILENEWRAVDAEPAATTAPALADEPAATTAPALADEPTVADHPALADEPAATTAPALADEPSAATTPMFNITLHKTYYNQGFFNVPVEIDNQVRQTEGPIELLLGDAEQPIMGRLDRKTNPNGTARIFGGSKLRKWFMTTFQLLEPVNITIDSPDLLRLDRPAAPTREE